MSTAPICTLLNHGSHGPRADAVGSFAYESSYAFRVERRCTRRDVHTVVRLGICTTHLCGTIKLFDRVDDTGDVDLPRRGSARVLCAVYAWRVNRKYENGRKHARDLLLLWRLGAGPVPGYFHRLSVSSDRSPSVPRETSDILQSFFVQYRLCRRNNASHKEQPLLASLNVVVVKQAKYIRRALLRESKPSKL